MTDLVESLVQKAGLTPEQANKSLEVIVEFVKEKFPMLAGAVDNIFETGGDQSSMFGGLPDRD